VLHLPSDVDTVVQDCQGKVLETAYLNAGLAEVHVPPAAC